MWLEENITNNPWSYKYSFNIKYNKSVLYILYTKNKIINWLIPQKNKTKQKLRRDVVYGNDKRKMEL